MSDREQKDRLRVYESHLFYITIVWMLYSQQHTWLQLGLLLIYIFPTNDTKTFSKLLQMFIIYSTPNINLLDLEQAKRQSQSGFFKKQIDITKRLKY